MPRNATTSLVATCSILTGIGLLAAGCTDSSAGRADAPLPCGTPVTRTFAIDHANPSAAVAQDIDLDGDDKPDDALGRANDLVAGFAPTFSIADRFAARLNTDIAWELQLDQCGDDTRVTIGPRPDGTGLPHLARAQGRFEAGTLTAADGQARLPLIALADAQRTIADPGWVVGDAVAMHLTLDGGTASGVFAMALPTETVRADLAAPIAAFLTAQAADQPMRVVADANHDGVVSADEVTATNTFQGMTDSDLEMEIDGAPQTSIAFRFTAHEATR